MGEQRVPDFVIEQYVLGELPSAKAREVEQSPGFADRVAAIERDTAAFLEAHPPQAFAKRIVNEYEARSAGQADRRAPRRARTVRILAFAVPGAAAVAVVALVLFGGIGVDPRSVVDPGAEIVRLKGLEPTISVYRAATGSIEELEDGDSAAAGDRLQVAYNAGDAPFGMIVSVDGRGSVTLHFPVTQSADPELVVGGEQRLPYAYVLDDAPEFERFFFITSATSFRVRDVLAAVERQAASLASDSDAPLDLSDDLTVDSLTLRKGE